MRIGPILLFLVFFLACSDDDSDFAVRPSDGSSSSVKKIATNSSSSLNDKYSSSSEYKRVPCNVEKDENCMKDERDGQTYRTTKIGDKVWMAENLNYETPDSYCYNDDTTNCTKYGRLYKWTAVVGQSEDSCGYGHLCSLPSGNIQGVCPEGWYLPDQDYLGRRLFMIVRGETSVGVNLRSTSGWYDNGNGTDVFSFSALPAGSRKPDGNYEKEGTDAHFWTSSEFDSTTAFILDLHYNDNTHVHNYPKSYAQSVRCLKDSPE